VLYLDTRNRLILDHL
jgi:DNA repair protein RadC